MSINLCKHDLPLRACEICREAADLLGKGDNVLISRVYLTAWVREAHRYQDAGKKLEALEKENAELREELAVARKASLFVVDFLQQLIAAISIDRNCSSSLRTTAKVFKQKIDDAIAKEVK